MGNNRAPGHGPFMKDISEKNMTLRYAKAEGFIYMDPSVLEKARNKKGPKGDVIPVSRVAGIMASKDTSRLIPMCHNIKLSSCCISFDLRDDNIHVVAEAKATDSTGVEMEALTAVSIALLNIYDMLKSLDRSMEISGIRLLEKSGGVSGHYKRQD